MSLRGFQYFSHGVTIPSEFLGDSAIVLVENGHEFLSRHLAQADIPELVLLLVDVCYVCYCISQMMQ